MEIKFTIHQAQRQTICLSFIQLEVLLRTEASYKIWASVQVLQGFRDKDLFINNRQEIHQSGEDFLIWEERQKSFYSIYMQVVIIEFIRAKAPPTGNKMSIPSIDLNGRLYVPSHVLLF